MPAPVAVVPPLVPVPVPVPLTVEVAPVAVEPVFEVWTPVPPVTVELPGKTIIFPGALKPPFKLLLVELERVTLDWLRGLTGTPALAGGVVGTAFVEPPKTPVGVVPG